MAGISTSHVSKPLGALHYTASEMMTKALEYEIDEQSFDHFVYHSGDGRLMTFEVADRTLYITLPADQYLVMIGQWMSDDEPDDSLCIIPYLHAAQYLMLGLPLLCLMMRRLTENDLLSMCEELDNRGQPLRWYTQMQLRPEHSSLIQLFSLVRRQQDPYITPRTVLLGYDNYFEKQFRWALKSVVSKVMAQPYQCNEERMLGGAYVNCNFTTMEFKADLPHVQAAVRDIVWGVLKSNSVTQSPSTYHRTQSEQYYFYYQQFIPRARMQILRVAATMGLVHQILPWVTSKNNRSRATTTQMQHAYWDAACCIDEVEHNRDVLCLEEHLGNGAVFEGDYPMLWTRVRNAEFMDRVLPPDVIVRWVLQLQDGSLEINRMMQMISIEMMGRIMTYEELDWITTSNTLKACFHVPIRRMYVECGRIDIFRIVYARMLQMGIEPRIKLFVRALMDMGYIKDAIQVMTHYFSSNETLSGGIMYNYPHRTTAPSISAYLCQVLGLEGGDRSTGMHQNLLGASMQFLMNYRGRPGDDTHLIVELVVTEMRRMASLRPPQVDPARLLQAFAVEMLMKRYCGYESVRVMARHPYTRHLIQWPLLLQCVDVSLGERNLSFLLGLGEDIIRPEMVPHRVVAQIMSLEEPHRRLFFNDAVTRRFMTNYRSDDAHLMESIRDTARAVPLYENEVE